MVDSTSAILLVLILLQARPISSGSLNVDIAIVIHGEVQWWSASMTPVRERLREELPKLFRIGENGTRFALVANVNGTKFDQSNPENCFAHPGNWTVLQNLTGDFAEFKTSLDGLQQDVCTDENLTEALRMVREDVFVGSIWTGNRPRVILLLSIFNERRNPAGSARTPISSSTVEERFALKAASYSVTFVVFYETEDKTYTKYDEDYRNFVRQDGAYYRMVPKFHQPQGFPDAGFNAAAMKRFVTDLNEHLCVYGAFCFYTDKDRSECKKAFITSAKPDAGGDCNDVGYPPPLSADEDCNLEECEKQCGFMWNWRWPINQTGCNDDECGETNYTRLGEMRWKNLEFCTRKFVCPVPCSTSASQTTSLKEADHSSLPLILGVAFAIILIAALAAGVWFAMRKKYAGVTKKGKKGAGGKKKGASVATGKKAGKSKKKAASDIEAGSDVDTETRKKAGRVIESEKEPATSEKDSRLRKKAGSKKAMAVTKAASATSEKPTSAESGMEAATPIAKPKSKAVVCKIPARKRKTLTKKTKK